MCLPFRDKNLWCCGPRSIEMWLANCAPCQQSSPESIADKGDSLLPHSGARNIPCGDSSNVFSTAKKLAQTKLESWHIFVLKGAGVFSRPPTETQWMISSIVKGPEKKNNHSVAVMVRLERTHVCLTGSVLIHPPLPGAIPNSNQKV